MSRQREDYQTANHLPMAKHWKTENRMKPSGRPFRSLKYWQFWEEIPTLPLARKTTLGAFFSWNKNKISQIILLMEKSCTSWYGKCPILYKVLYIPGGAGFLQSTATQFKTWIEMVELTSWKSWNYKLSTSFSGFSLLNWWRKHHS